MRHWSAIRLIALILSLGVCPLAQAGTYQLANGQTITGDPIAPDKDGIIFKLDATQFTPRVAWTNFTEAALRQLAESSEVKPFVAALLFDEPDLPEPAQQTRPVIKPTEITRLTRPDPKAGFGALFSSPLSLVLLGLLYLANLYAAYQICWFRNFNPIAVVGLAAVIPVISPLVFLFLPSGSQEEEMPQEEYNEEEQAYAEEAAAAQAAPAQEAAPAAPPSASAKPAPLVYERGKFTFNRRFFETKLAGFLRVVPSEEEKDLVVVVESARGRHVGNRITRIMPNEIYLQVTKGGASSDIILPFNEIKVVTVRHKDG